MFFNLSLTIHIFGFTMLMGGMFVGLRAARLDNPSAELIKAVRFGYLLAGSLLVFVTGLIQIFDRGFSFYMKQGWFHGKLTLGLLLIAAGLYFFIKLGSVQKSRNPLTRRFTAIAQSVIGVLFLLTIISVIFGRTGMM